jgi:hypothetical protein
MQCLSSSFPASFFPSFCLAMSFFFQKHLFSYVLFPSFFVRIHRCAFTINSLLTRLSSLFWSLTPFPPPPISVPHAIQPKYELPWAPNILKTRSEIGTSVRENSLKNVSVIIYYCIFISLSPAIPLINRCVNWLPPREK